MNKERLENYKKLSIEKNTLESVKKELDSLKESAARGNRASKKRVTRNSVTAHSVITAETVEELLERKREELLSEMQTIESVIDALPPLMRAILRLRYIECLPWWKIANRVGYSDKQVRRYHDRAVEELSKKKACRTE